MLYYFLLSKLVLLVVLLFSFSLTFISFCLCNDAVNLPRRVQSCSAGEDASHRKDLLWSKQRRVDGGAGQGETRQRPAGGAASAADATTCQPGTSCGFLLDVLLWSVALHLLPLFRFVTCWTCWGTLKRLWSPVQLRDPQSLVWPPTWPSQRAVISWTCWAAWTPSLLVQVSYICIILCLSML